MNVRLYLAYDIKITLKSHFRRKNIKIVHYVHNVVMDVKNVSRKSRKQLVVYQFYGMAFYLSQMRRHMINGHIPNLLK